MFSARMRVGLAGLALMVCTSAASAQGLKPTLTAAVNGTTVTLSWTAVDGATGYQLFVQAGGQVIGPANVTGTALTLPGVPPGLYILAVRGTAGAQVGPLSDAVPLNVAITPPPPPAPPSNFAAIISNNTVALTWTVPPGAANIFLQAGTQTGGSDLGTFPMGTASSLLLPSLPSSNYFLRLYSLGVGGPSAPSPELVVSTPGCVAPATLPLTASGVGGVAQLSWPAVPGSVGYRLDAASSPAGGADIGSFPIAANATTFTASGIPAGSYYVTLHTTMSCGPSVSSAVTHLNVVAPPPAVSQARAEQMTLAAAIAVSNAFPGDLQRSCGNNTWLFRVLQLLRSQDTRFGLNWKRGVRGDMSQDVITYKHGNVPDDQATGRHTYAWDVIGGHCGSRPRPHVLNLTNPNGDGIYTIEPYLRAGLTP